MPVLAQILIGLVAALHVGFLVLEMVFWDKPLGRRVFGLRPEFARESKALAANQGLYNGFLAGGLIWSLLLDDPTTAVAVAVFFLSCVVAAGIFGAITVSRTILWVQALPAAIALAFVFFG